MANPSFLIIGATGRTGLHLLRAAAKQNPSPAIHAFVRTPSKLPPTDAASCTSVITGNALNVTDLTTALRQSSATHVLIAVGEGDSRSPTNIRRQSAAALMEAGVRRNGEFDGVFVGVISSTGAGGTKMEVGFGLGVILAYWLRHVMRDHDGQERALMEGMGKDVSDRLIIVRPTALTDGKAKGLDSIVLFDKSTKAPSVYVDRADVALWLVTEMCSEKPRYGSFFSLTSV